jgi:hypothetical protein
MNAPEPDERKEREEPTAMQRFEAFAKRLISVPKRELDERQQAYQDEREREQVAKDSEL